MSENLTFRALSLCQSDWRNGGLCEGLYAESGATLLVGVWWRENKNKLVEWKVLVDTVGIKSAYLEVNILFLVFCSFPNCLDVRKGRKLPYVVWND